MLFIVLTLIVVELVSFAIGEITAPKEEVGLPVFDGQDCLPSDIRLEAFLPAGNQFSEKSGVHFTLRTTMLGTKACKIPTSLDARRLTISDSNGNIAYAVTDACVNEPAPLGSGLLLTPGDPPVDEDFFWNGKSTSQYLTEPKKNEDGEPEVDMQGNPLIGDDGKPLINQWCNPGLYVGKGNYSAVFEYQMIGGQPVNMITNSLGFSIN